MIVDRGHDVDHAYLLHSDLVRTARGNDWVVSHSVNDEDLPEHERTHYIYAGPSEDPYRHGVAYSIPEKGKVDFHHSREDLHESYGGDVADRLRKTVLDRHKATEYTPPPKKGPTLAPPGVYYHGTRVKGVTHILPANHHGGDTHSPDSDRDYAYATPNIRDAWDYAEAAGGEGRPRVYRVHPIGGDHHVEVDPTHDAKGNPRYTNPHDKRSPHGFQVVGEEHDAPHDIRKYYSDEEWGKD